MSTLYNTIDGAGSNSDNFTQPTDIKKADDSYLKKQGIDAHELKKDARGTDKGNSLYDIYVDKDTNQLWVFRKGGIGEGIPTGVYLN